MSLFKNDKSERKLYAFAIDVCRRKTSESVSAGYSVANAYKDGSRIL